jgi:hypothetical protein
MGWAAAAGALGTGLGALGNYLGARDERKEQKELQREALNRADKQNAWERQREQRRWDWYQRYMNQRQANQRMLAHRYGGNFGGMASRRRRGAAGSI